MSNTTYSHELFRPHGSTLALLREVFAATPLAIMIAALRAGRGRAAR